MNGSDIDKLFQSKLSGKTVKPSEEAWAKLSGALNKPKKARVFVYWSVAACVAVLLSAAVYFSTRNTAEITAPVAEQKIAGEEGPMNDERNDFAEIQQNEETEIAAKEEVEKAPGLHLSAESKKHLSTEIKERNPINRQAETGQPKEELAETVTQGQAKENRETTDEALPEVQKEEASPLQLLALELPSPADVAQKEEENYPEIKIIYKSSETTHENKRTLQKVVGLARDIREADIGLGTLREAKNELLAFGIKKVRDN